MTIQTPELAKPTRIRPIAGLTFLIAVGLPVAAILTAGMRGADVPPGLVDWIFVAAVAVLTLATYGLLVPWASRATVRRAATTGLALSISALLLSAMFFWTMVPVIFGSAGAWLGHTARHAARGGRGHAGVPTSAMLVGALAALGSVAAYIATS